MKARGSSVFQLTPDAAMTLLEHAPAVAVADVVLLDVRLEGISGPPDFLAVMGIGGAIRRLPETSAMSDGRKWGLVPLVWMKRGIVSSPPTDVIQGESDHDFHEITIGNDVSAAYRDLRVIVWNYYKRLADDYTDIGYVVTEDFGRMRVEIAYAPPSDTSTKYYYRPADRRRTKIFTLARSPEGDANDLADFGDLIDPAARATEHRLHRFLADAPHILTLEPGEILSHPRIGAGQGRRELDFAFRPYVNRAEPESWWILEIKRAFPSLMAAITSGNPRLAAALMHAANQVRGYKRLIEDPRSRNHVIEALGEIPRDAKLAILIGRRSVEYRDVLENKLHHEMPDVALITYDDLFGSRESAVRLSTS